MDRPPALSGKRPACFAGLALVLTLGPAVCGQSQRAPASLPEFGVGKALAQVDATVTDSKGRRGKELTAADFEVFVDGERIPAAGAACVERRHPAGYPDGSCSNATAAIHQRRSAAAGGEGEGDGEGDSLK